MHNVTDADFASQVLTIRTSDQPLTKGSIVC